MCCSTSTAAGRSGEETQPNLCALKKTLSGLHKHNLKHHWPTVTVLISFSFCRFCSACHAAAQDAGECSAAHAAAWLRCSTLCSTLCSTICCATALQHKLKYVLQQGSSFCYLRRICKLFHTIGDDLSKK